MLLTLAAAKDSQFDAEIAAALKATSTVYAVPASLVKAVIRQESAFNPNAVSKCGAIGLMQVMPFNAAKLGVDEKKLKEPATNILAGVRLLAALLKHYDGDVVAALVAYNSGPKAKLAPVPKNGETPEYVVRILGFWKSYADAAR